MDRLYQIREILHMKNSVFLLEIAAVFQMGYEFLKVPRGAEIIEPFVLEHLVDRGKCVAGESFFKAVHPFFALAH